MASVAVKALMDWNLLTCVYITGSGLCSVLQEMENAWNEYSRLERDVDWLKSALQAQMNRSDLSQVCGLLIHFNTNTQTHTHTRCSLHNELLAIDVTCIDKEKNSVYKLLFGKIDLLSVIGCHGLQMMCVSVFLRAARENPDQKRAVED